MTIRFVRAKEAPLAKVCRGVPPVYIRKKGQAKIPDSSKRKYQKIVLVIPDEYAFALMEMYGNVGLQKAIMKLIKSNVVPMEDE